MIYNIKYRYVLIIDIYICKYIYMYIIYVCENLYAVSDMNRFKTCEQNALWTLLSMTNISSFWRSFFQMVVFGIIA